MDPPAGLDAKVLAERARVLRTARPLTDRELARWLVEQRLAVRRNGRLEPTKLGAELGRAFNQL